MEDRLLKFMDKEQLSSAKFADVIGVQRSSVSHILSGRNKPSFDFLQKTLKAFPMINADWLILGEGNMYEGEVNAVSGTLFDQVPADRPENVEKPTNITGQPASSANAHSDLSPAGNDISGTAESGAEIPNSNEGKEEKIRLKEGSESIPSGAEFSHFSNEQRAIVDSTGKRSKTISRVIVLYTDKTFETYENAE